MDKRYWQHTTLSLGELFLRNKDARFGALQSQIAKRATTAN
jgi:hypothetical protein